MISCVSSTESCNAFQLNSASSHCGCESLDVNESELPETVTLRANEMRNESSSCKRSIEIDHAMYSAATAMSSGRKYNHTVVGKLHKWQR